MEHKTALSGVLSVVFWPTSSGFTNISIQNVSMIRNGV